MDTARPRPLFDVLAGLHAVAVAVLVVLAVATLRMYCEGFGCIGRGIAWFAWACGYAVVLVVGGVLRWRFPPRVRWRAVLRLALALQLVLGVGLLATWLVRHAG